MPRDFTNLHLTWAAQLQAGNLAALAAEMTAALDAWAAAPLTALTRPQADVIASAFLKIFCDSAFLLPDALAEQFVRRNHLVSNLVALSSTGTTDACLQHVRSQPSAHAKLLTLCSARNSTPLDSAALFRRHPYLASIWYMQFAELFHAGLVSPHIRGNLRRHFAFADPALLPVFNLQEPYFGASYVDRQCERVAKPAINAAIRRAAAIRTGAGPRDPRKIAVVTAHWQPPHSVYRICAGLVAALRPRFNLTLASWDLPRQALAGFDAALPLRTANGIVDPGPLLDADFQMLLFPDVGMNSESTILANLRLAPMQVALLGHSVSTFGAAVDFFVTGAEVEDATLAQQNYSEKVILLPGAGIVHNKPLYIRKGSPALGQRVVINCPWLSHKVTDESLALLARLRAAISRPLLFRLFVGSGTALYHDHALFTQAVHHALGSADCEVVASLPYESYMTLLEQGDLALDAWHFGGCNTVSDSLYVGVPVLCREGARWYNRIGSHMLRQAGLPELIATGESDFFTSARRLIEDDGFRLDLSARLAGTNLDHTVYSDADAIPFLRAVERLCQDPEKWRNSPERVLIT